MNKRLREFERESKLEIFGLGAKRIPWEAALEKYAELIVAECLLKIENERFELPDFIIDSVKEHFGVLS